jgi:glutaredoxin 2
MATQTLFVSPEDFKNLDSVEIKMTLADKHKPIIRELLSQALTPQKLWIYFFDTTDLQLFNNHQTILRVRSKDNKEDDSTVKLRKVEPSWTFSEWRDTKGEFKVEGDWVADKIIRSASFSFVREEGIIEKVAAGRESIDKLFSKEQEKFLEKAISTIVNFSTLKVLGPIEVYKWKKKISDLDEELCLEYWQLENAKDVLQDKQEILELSVKATLDNSRQIWKQFNQFLEKHGIDLGGEQAPKTRTALEFFASTISDDKFR